MLCPNLRWTEITIQNKKQEPKGDMALVTGSDPKVIYFIFLARQEAPNSSKR